jgi:hypothetical protein
MPIGNLEHQIQSNCEVHPLLPGRRAPTEAFPLCSFYEDRKYNYINLFVEY